VVGDNSAKFSQQASQNLGKYILQYMYIHIWYVNAHKREAHTETTPYGH